MNSKKLTTVAGMMGALGALDGMTATSTPYGMGPGLYRRRSAYQIRHDPSRPKTEADLRKMQAAEERRQRRAAKRRGVPVPPEHSIPGWYALDAGAELQIGDMFVSIDGEKLPIDKNGEVMGVVVVERPVEIKGYWYRRMVDTPMVDSDDTDS